MKKIGVTEFRKDMPKTIKSLKTNEKIEIIKNNKVVGIFIKKEK